MENAVEDHHRDGHDHLAGDIRWREDGGVHEGAQHEPAPVADELQVVDDAGHRQKKMNSGSRR